MQFFILFEDMEGKWTRRIRNLLQLFVDISIGIFNDFIEFLKFLKASKISKKSQKSQKLIKIFQIRHFQIKNIKNTGEFACVQSCARQSLSIPMHNKYPLLIIRSISSLNAHFFLLVRRGISSLISVKHACQCKYVYHNKDFLIACCGYRRCTSDCEIVYRVSN